MSSEEPDHIQAKHRLEEAKLGLMRAKLEVEFWQQRIQELESVINASKQDESFIASINAAEWTEVNESFAWAFRTNRDGSERPEILPLVRAIENQKDRKLKLGSYEYSISSNGKFIQRRKISQEKQ